MSDVPFSFDRDMPAYWAARNSSNEDPFLFNIMWTLASLEPEAQKLGAVGGQFMVASNCKKYRFHAFCLAGVMLKPSDNMINSAPRLSPGGPTAEEVWRAMILSVTGAVHEVSREGDMLTFTPTQNPDLS